ncbi:sensor histidine kinase [Myxococcus xanthus DK 1622]|uniref:histidine kinase n=1 Tax=Myxococcus xanthus (strain DK1622) TaxID=246197 RepID=Q306N8_MYXXD|nr:MULTISPECIES: ATP-binding protein [Myxococcus]ABB43052.1 PilS2 [Myxococcus xanthus DK 1622]ABF88543.1 sensor histidine kinase [Myxococcus xanthus DK 1622]NOJ56609.1 two-component sensor histidine kinase [Myxococcus xanthus]QPM78194.1 two-component sensor histidine kinase [Myxococcus xanthus]QVW67261.1 two-component sensor histidine kinase [Myxococcus xanthus DZ2]
MKWRIASVAFLLGALSSGLTWLSVQPVLLRLLDALRRWVPEGSAEEATLARVQGLLPWVLGLDLVALTVLTYVVLDLMVGRPLRRTEAVVEQFGRLDWEAHLVPTQGGTLVSRIQRALQRMAEALREEQALTRAQMASLRASHAQLARTQTELVASERMATVGRLAAGVAHEVGNPLAGILGYVALARVKADTPELKDFLERIDHEVQRIDRIIRGLLDLGRPGVTSLGPVEVGPVVETCVRLVRASPELSGVTVTLDLEPGALARTDAGPLSQIVINLLLNAAQAMGGQGRVRVATRQAAGEVRLLVEDDGTGIPEDVMPRLFEPFFTTKGREGTGLGLAVSQRLAQVMGGRLEAENIPSGGARFTVCLPVP